MNLQESYKILEIPPGSTPEEAKKAFKKLAAKYHPDINKDLDAENKFKQVNEAYQNISKPKPQPQFSNPFSNPFSGFQYEMPQFENIEVYLTIDFKDSILGTKKDIKYTRNSKCQVCSGSGEINQNNGCQKCAGKGKITNRQGNSIFISTCPDCHGRSPISPCTNCNQNGYISSNISINVSIPPGVSSGNILRLQGMGHFAGSFMGLQDQYTDVFCHITVSPDSNLLLSNKDVIYTLSISLAEAVLGCSKTVPTIQGEKEITIAPKSRHKEEILLPNLGVNLQNHQRVILDVTYPDNIESLVKGI